MLWISWITKAVVEISPLEKPRDQWNKTGAKKDQYYHFEYVALEKFMSIY